MANMIPISTVTVGSGGVATISFTGIPQTYTDLCLKFSGRDASATVRNNIIIRPNGSSTSQAIRFIFADGSTVSGASDTLIYTTGVVGANATASTFSNVEIYIPNYTSTNYKSFSMDAVTENNATANGMQLSGALWSNTSPISSIDMVLNGGGNFSQYTTATLYGIRKY
jgi:accessory colonization factor AcfC